MNKNNLPVVIITGASSGVGLHSAKSLADREWYVVMACRDVEKAAKAAKQIGIPTQCYTVMSIDLGSQVSVRSFVEQFHASGLALDALVCNAAVYLPLRKEPLRSPEGYEISVATNYLGHFLLSHLLLKDLAAPTSCAPRLVTLGTVTANSVEFAGKIPIPAPANLGSLQGLEAGFKDPIAMIDGKRFKPGKAYKDSKLCNMIMSREFDRRFHADTDITFCTLYPGCVADSALFRDTPAFFKKVFPWFQKNITKGYITQTLAGERVADVVINDVFLPSGAHWSWGSRQRPDAHAFAQPLSVKATNHELGNRLWDFSLSMTGLAE